MSGDDSTCARQAFPYTTTGPIKMVQKAHMSVWQWELCEGALELVQPWRIPFLTWGIPYARTVHARTVCTYVCTTSHVAKRVLVIEDPPWHWRGRPHVMCHMLYNSILSQAATPLYCGTRAHQDKAWYMSCAHVVCLLCVQSSTA
jgi:hypothetical protein